MRSNKLVRVSLYAAVVASVGACTEIASTESESHLRDYLPNNFPISNALGDSASFSTQGEVSLVNAFFTPQGTNGRDCSTCHVPSDGWSITPATAQRFFDETAGLHPLFSRLDADKPTYTSAQLLAMTVDERRQVFSMLLAGKFTRNVAVPVLRDYEVIDAQDPFGVGTTAKLWFFRRPLATANFKSQTVMWDASNTIAGDLRGGLIKQARGNVTGAQEGLPASDATIFEMVDYEAGMFNAQILISGVGRLDGDGATGGPQAHASQPLVAGRFDMFDGWATSDNPRQLQIYRGQELFNNGDNNGKQCAGCHNAANSGQNVDGRLFNVGASKPEFATPDMAIYTFQNIADGTIVQSTDPGRGIRTGKFADLNRFKTPSLRGLAARAPYFHNGIAATIADIVSFYEQSLGFDFTPEQEADLAAFLSAL